MRAMVVDPEVLSREQLVDALIMVFRDVVGVRLQARDHSDDELRAALRNEWQRRDVRNVVLPSEWDGVFADGGIDVEFG